MMKLMVIVPLVAIVVALSAFTSPSTGVMNKASHSVSHESTHVESKGQFRPYCSGYVTASPHTQYVYVHATAVLHVNWYCEGGFHVVVNVNWGDGSSSNYTCWANCTSGEQDMDSSYNNTGTYHPNIYMNGSASGSTSATIIVQ